MFKPVARELVLQLVKLCEDGADIRDGYEEERERLINLIVRGNEPPVEREGDYIL